MSYRSWLKDVKSIHDLGEHCYHLSRHKPEDYERELRYEEKWMARLQREIPVAPEYRFAFGSYMHDSWIEWIKRDPKELRIRINNDLAQHFVDEVCKMLDIHIPTFLKLSYMRNSPTDIDDWVAPVDLIFDDPIYVNAVRADLRGKLRWSEWRGLGRQDGWKADQFLYDWFFEQDGRIQCVICTYDFRGSSRFSNSLYLLIDCSQVRAEDGRAKAIAKVLSPEAAEISGPTLSRWSTMMMREVAGAIWWAMLREGSKPVV